MPSSKQAIAVRLEEDVDLCWRTWAKAQGRPVANLVTHALSEIVYRGSFTRAGVAPAVHEQIDIMEQIARSPSVKKGKRSARKK